MRIDDFIVYCIISINFYSFLKRCLIEYIDLAKIEMCDMKTTIETSNLGLLNNLKK